MDYFETSVSLTLPTGRKLDDIKESLEGGLFDFEIYWKLSHVVVMPTAAFVSLYCKRVALCLDKGIKAGTVNCDRDIN